MVSNNSQLPVGSPRKSRSTTPVALPSSVSGPVPPNAPSQAPSPTYQSPYARSAPFPPVSSQIQTPTPIRPPYNPQVFTEPRSATATPTPAASVPASQNGVSSTPGYAAYAQELRQAAGKIRSGRLSPVSHVRNALAITSSTVCTPPSLQRLAGVMAGNPMINSVKVIQRLADGYEEVCDQLDERNATIRQLEASQAQLQASQAQMQANQAQTQAEQARPTQKAIDAAVVDALRIQRPAPKPTAQQEADLKVRDDKIKVLEEFAQIVTNRVKDAEAARDHAQNIQLDMKTKHEKELATKKAEIERLEHELSDAESQAQLRQDFIQSQGSDQGNDYDHSHGHVQGQNQAFDPNLDFFQSQAFVQGPPIDFESLFASQVPDTEHNREHRQGSDFAQHSQQSFVGQQSFLQQPTMPGFSQDMFPSLLQQGFGPGMGLGFGLAPQTSAQVTDVSFGMNSQPTQPDILFEREMANRRARTVQESFSSQYSDTQQAAQDYQNTQGQIQGQYNPTTPSRYQRIPSHIQQSPQSFQNMPDQGRSQNSTPTPKRQRTLASQQSTPRSKNNQGQGYQNTPSPANLHTPQPRGKRGRPTKKDQQVSAQQNMNSQAAQQLGPAYQDQNDEPANQVPAQPRRTTQTRGPKKAQAPNQQTTFGLQMDGQGYQDNTQDRGYFQGPTGSQENLPPPPKSRKRDASSQDDQQDGSSSTPQGETGKISLDTLRRNVRRTFPQGYVNLDGGYKRSF